MIRFGSTRVLYECNNADIFYGQDVVVTKAAMELLSNDTCDVGLRMQLQLAKQRGKEDPDRHEHIGYPNSRWTRNRVDGLMFACEHCEHNQQLQFSVSVDRRHDRKVSDTRDNVSEKNISRGTSGSLEMVKKGKGFPYSIPSVGARC